MTKAIRKAVAELLPEMRLQHLCESAIEAATKKEFCLHWPEENWNKASAIRKSSYTDKASRYIDTYLTSLEAEGGATRGNHVSVGPSGAGHSNMGSAAFWQGSFDFIVIKL
jgi:hypothetical protein